MGRFLRGRHGKGLGFGVWGLGFRVLGAVGLRVLGDLGLGFAMLG